MKQKAATQLSVSISIIVIIAGFCSIFELNRQMKIHAQEEATKKARILLDRNLATHTYFSHQLKPNLFKKLEPFAEKSYFDPVWMSSTYAVREIDKYYHKIEKQNYYYKEAAINARNPENEADSFERDFIEKLNASSDLVEHSMVKSISDRPFFVVLRRGETLDQNCLRCHSTPEMAPADMVDYYGPERSFNRRKGETISAISIRIPLAEAYRDINKLIWKLSGLFGIILLIVNGCSIYLSNHWIFRPLNNIRIKAMEIAKNPEALGEHIVSPATQELFELTQAFNRMSYKLRQKKDDLESRVDERTVELNTVNLQLETEVDEHKKSIIKLENSLTEIKKLSGLLPICGHCKKIRDDKGYWNQIESYIQENSEAVFSHGICQDCAKKYYPDHDLNEK